MLKTKLILGLTACPAYGAGAVLFQLFSQQSTVDTRLESRPLLPWAGDAHSTSDFAFEIRFDRLRKSCTKPCIADIGAHYFPHLRRILDLEPDTRVVHLRIAPGIVASTFDQLSHVQPLLYDHWSDEPATDAHRDIDWARTFPKYENLSRDESIRRYVGECEQFIDDAAIRFPKQVLIVTLDDLARLDGVKKVLDFIGVPPGDQSFHVFNPSALTSPVLVDQPKPSNPIIADRRRCGVLVPYSTFILQETEQQLRKLEELGYTVRRQGGVSAIDQGRSQMATDALLDGFEETLWIDSDMSFDPNSVDQLRSHGEPIISGLYAKKGVRGLASQFLSETTQIMLGTQGQVVELKYAATGFLLVHRSVYSTIQERLNLPVCNELFKGRPIIPFFLPMTVPHDDAYWYIGEDYAFSHRARECGFKILADTSIRLWHVGNYHYGWEDAGSDVKRFDSYHFTLGPG